ncbi:MAG: hypothetical protein HC873_04510 [Leptolyngbyaceae cyanobacterium SL_1_1]|nr:hypothetical protein [Leptolyngbyaceae cyanobacterium RM1_1_2]NJO09038.1 hypothetical protein [Leptolyngbyaceae cyanobacterium SL_1_1]
MANLEQQLPKMNYFPEKDVLHSPLLVVEVVSQSTKSDDHRSKRAEYGLLEIPEYWIVAPPGGKVTLCILEHQFYDFTEYHDAQ